ncbi:MAG: RAD55 family ATPase [Alphaproteobacteria bacterium]
MTEQESSGAGGELTRVPSTVPGLDTVLGGGFFSGGLYLILGVAGAGKTVLGSQIIYSRAARGGRALFVTALGESHGRMLAHLQPMRFFDQSLVPDRITYISAYQALDDDENGLKRLLDLLRREVQASSATLLVLDGLSAIVARASSLFAMKRFTHELQILASATDCTMFLLTTGSGAMTGPEHTMVDGVIELKQRLYSSRNERRLQVHKIRGSGFLEGEHAYRISREGLTVFPRFEAQYGVPERRALPVARRQTSGIASLDALLDGGLPAAAQVSLVGPSGTGKTTFCLQFISASSAAEPGLLLGCFEPPERLRLKAETMGFGLAAAEQRGDVELIWCPIGEQSLDELAHKLLDAVRRRGVKRLVIDGIIGFEQAALEKERMVRFWSALSSELRALDVTTLHTTELPEMTGAELRLPQGISPLAETLILLRYVELRSRLYRLISVFKMRDGAFDTTIRQFSITDEGIVIEKPFEGVEAILSGVPREAAVREATEDGGLNSRPDPGGQPQ